MITKLNKLWDDEMNMKWGILEKKEKRNVIQVRKVGIASIFFILMYISDFTIPKVIDGFIRA